MKITGTQRIDAPREQVWDALQDPAVLVRTLPGCTALVATGDDTYEATMEVGVASIRGTYRGTVRLFDTQAPASYRMHVSGAGVPGTVDADVSVQLDDDAGATVITYDADAQVGGMIGGVGQRMLSGVAKRMAAEFFRAVERDLQHAPAAAASEDGATTPAPAASPSEADDGAPAADAARASIQLGRSFRASASRPAGGELVTASVAGGLLALAGVLVGRRLSRPGRR
ncbi:MAG: carbon monoxide dehydrogenase subunit G [Nitriliruptoraceae bacterium]